MPTSNIVLITGASSGIGKAISKKFSSENYQVMKVGTMLIDCLESVARERKHSFIVLQSRQSAIEFYKKNGFNLVKKTYLLFGEIQHFLMNKSL